MNCPPALREERGAARDRCERRQEAQRPAAPRGEAQPGKEGPREALPLPEMAPRSPKTARGPERGDRSEQAACQVAKLALEMTEDAPREASMYLSRCDSDRCATKRALRHSRTADSASWDHQALGERPRRPKGTEALAASSKKREKEWAAWWMLSASKSREGRRPATQDWQISQLAFLQLNLGGRVPG